MNIDITNYLDSWMQYNIECNLRVKGKAKLNADCWRKLRQFHLEQYVKQQEVPFNFMFSLRYKHKNIYKQIACASSIYKICLQKRNSMFEEKRYANKSERA